MPEWRDIWAARRLEPARGTALAQLLAADGFDTGFGTMPEAAWRDYVGRCAERLGITASDTVFEVGCGAGAFLYPLAERGCRVGGLDYSPALITLARAAMPNGSWQDGEAGVALPTADVVLASGVFLYLPSPAEAERVLISMATAARRGLMVLDVPDAARRAATEMQRRATLGESEYERRYAGLQHLYLDRDWFPPRLPGYTVAIEDQAIPGYANSAGRFNVFARRSDLRHPNALPGSR